MAGSHTLTVSQAAPAPKCFSFIRKPGWGTKRSSIPELGLCVGPRAPRIWHEFLGHFSAFLPSLSRGVSWSREQPSPRRSAPRGAHAARPSASSQRCPKPSQRGQQHGPALPAARWGQNAAPSAWPGGCCCRRVAGLICNRAALLIAQAALPVEFSASQCSAFQAICRTSIQGYF